MKSLATLLVTVATPLMIAATATPAAELSDADVENLVKRSYQYVAMYNVNNKFALKLGRWNTCDADTMLKDHTMREIARPNNDTLYISCLLDLRKDPVILEMPAFDSKYVSLMVTGYDHYVNIPMSTRLGDFGRPEKMLIYSTRTEGYQGEAIKGVGRRFEATGDFVSAVFRVMPHANDPQRFKRIVGQMQSVKPVTLSELGGGKAKPIDDIKFPPVGKTDADVFGNNLLEVMQFVFNHTTFDPKNELDQAVLAAYAPLGIAPGRTFDPAQAPKIDGPTFRAAAERIAAAELAKTNDQRPGIQEHDEQHVPAQGPHDPGVAAVPVSDRSHRDAGQRSALPAGGDGRRQADERHARLRRPHGEEGPAAREGVLVGDAVRRAERLLHSQRAQEVQRRRERRHEARQGRWHCHLHLGAEAQGSAGGELAADQPQGRGHRRDHADLRPGHGEDEDVERTKSRKARGTVSGGVWR